MSNQGALRAIQVHFDARRAGGLTRVRTAPVLAVGDRVLAFCPYDEQQAEAVVVRAARPLILLRVDWSTEADYESPPLFSTGTGC